MALLLRGKSYHWRRRVPKRFLDIEPRRVVWISLDTDSERMARSKAVQIWEALIAAWEARQAGNSADAQRRFAAAQDLAKRRGFADASHTELAEAPLEKLLARIEAISTAATGPDPVEARALLGGVDAPSLTLSGALEAYWELAADKTLGKSGDQLRRWRNPRIKAFRNLIALVGDKPIQELSRDDMLDFRQFWLERIADGEVRANSANKDLIHLGDVLKNVNRMKRLGLDLPLGELSFKEGTKRSRPPFSESWIREHILCPRALDGLNGEARAILLGMINTGYRPSEGAALTRETIRLDGDVPHISIEPDGRQLKSQYARRVIPLVGVSLEALREYPEGFPRYRHKAGLSATVNKYLRAQGLLETEEHSLYSLRHAFEDRMLAAGIDDRIRRDVFGHRLDRERYGKGASLAHVASLIRQIAL
jgi:integrase